MSYTIWQLYAAAIQKDQALEDVSPNSLLNLILKGLAEDWTAKGARTTLGLPCGFPAKKHNNLATLLCPYQSHWQQHDSLLYYRMQLYVPTAGEGCMEAL